MCKGENLFKQGFAQAVAKGDAKTGGILLRGLDKLRRAVGIKNSPSARDIAMLERLVMQAMENRTDTRSGEGVQYAIVALQDGKIYVQADRNVIQGETKAEQRKEITNFFNILLDQQPSIDIHTIEGDVLTITKKDTANKARDDYKKQNGRDVRMSDQEFAVKLRAEAHIDEIAETSFEIGGKDDSKDHAIAKDGFTYRQAYFRDFDGDYYKITLSIGNAGTVATVYNIGKIKKDALPSAKIIAVVGSKPLGKTSFDNRVTQTDPVVNTHSMQSGGGYTQSAYISEDQFVDRMGETPSGADGATSLVEGGYEKKSRGAVAPRLFLKNKKNRHPNSDPRATCANE